jgi:type II secretory pathway pseudopilin PulG
VILRWGVPVVAILCLLSAAAWFTTRTSDDDSPATAEAKATAALVNIRLALSQYALSKDDKYPSTLEPLDAQVAVPVEDAKVEGYSIVYKSLPSESDGMIRGFTLLAQPEKKNWRSFYIDQSGVLRSTEESRPARIDDPPI